MKTILIIQNWEAESAGTIADYLQEKSLKYKVIRTFENDPLPSLDELKAVIVLGYPNTVNNYQNQPGMSELFSFMAEVIRADMPIMGICYGSQMLAKVMGAEVKENNQKEIGIYPAKLTEAGSNDPLFKGFEAEFNVFHWHGDTFKIPHGASNLCETETCTNQAFRKGNSVGLQFHMEPRLDEVPVWCDEYERELKEEGKTKDQIVSDFKSHAEIIRKLNYKLIENFLNLKS